MGSSGDVVIRPFDVDADVEGLVEMWASDEVGHWGAATSPESDRTLILAEDPATARGYRCLRDFR